MCVRVFSLCVCVQIYLKKESKDWKTKGIRSKREITTSNSHQHATLGDGRKEGEAIKGARTTASVVGRPKKKLKAHFILKATVNPKSFLSNNKHFCLCLYFFLCIVSSPFPRHEMIRPYFSGWVMVFCGWKGLKDFYIYSPNVEEQIDFL